MIAKNISAETTDSLKLYVPTLHLLRFSFLLGSVLKFWLGLGKHHVWPDLLRSPHTRLESSQICWKISSVFILTNATTQRQTSVSCLASVCHTLHLLLWKSFKHVHVLHKCPYEASAMSSFNASVVCRNDESKRFIQGTRPVFEVKSFPHMMGGQSVLLFSVAFYIVSDVFLPELHGRQITAFESVKGVCWNSARPAQRFCTQSSAKHKALISNKNMSNLQTQNPSFELFKW